MESSGVNGPGNRAVIWLQGCKGMTCAAQCWNQQTHDPNGGCEMTLFEIMEWIRSALQKGAEGLTISGGEPMQQAQFLLVLLRNLRKHLPNLSIGMFSGYSEKELGSGVYAPGMKMGHELATSVYRSILWRDIKTSLDFAVLGRFNPLLPSTLPLTTSSNQKLMLFSDRHTLADFGQQSIEITIDENGFTETTGFPILGEL